MKHRSIWNKLLKKELVHVIENCLVDDPIQTMMKIRNAQLEMELEGGGVCCWECRHIAKKLGMK